MSATATFDRAEAVELIFKFVGTQPADPEGFRAWLNSLTDEQLQHYYDKVKDEVPV